MIDTTLLQFVNAKGVGEATIRRLAGLAMREGITPSELLEMAPKSMARLMGISESVARNIHEARDPAVQQGKTLDMSGIHVLWLADPRYPARLKANLGDDSPPFIFVRGNLDLLGHSSVGFCGSRKASAKGIHITDAIARLLTGEQICAVSGYAQGVDMAAHRAALQAGGTTILVLAEGILRFNIKRGIGSLLQPGNHLVVSQFPPRLMWNGRNAMKRNTTIIGLSDAMVLVESGMSGGTFAAGSESIKRRHPLFVIDFAQPAASAKGNRYFLERGGVPLRGDREYVPKIQSLLDAVRYPRWRIEEAAQTIVNQPEQVDFPSP